MILLTSASVIWISMGVIPGASSRINFHRWWLVILGISHTKRVSGRAPGSRITTIIYNVYNLQ